MPTSPPSGYTGIYVSTSFFPMSWLLLFCKPTIVIDGTPHRRSWGVHFFPLRPGRHTVEVSYRYFFLECGPAEEDLQLREGRVHRLFYYKAPMMFSPGSLYDAGPGPTPTMSANIILAWVLAAISALVLAVPALCCGGGLIVSAFQAAMRQGQQKADQAEDGRKEKEFERDEAERKRVAAEEDAARRKDLDE